MVYSSSAFSPKIGKTRFLSIYLYVGNSSVLLNMIIHLIIKMHHFGTLLRFCVPKSTQDNYNDLIFNCIIRKPSSTSAK